MIELMPGPWASALGDELRQPYIRALDAFLEQAEAGGETVFPPWMGAGEDDFDDPSTGTGYEGALVFALAEEMGFPVALKVVSDQVPHIEITEIGFILHDHPA